MLANPNPMHPGLVLNEVYMQELGLNQSALARKLHCAHRKVNEIVNGKRGITPEFAIELEVALGTPASMWVHMQAEFDLHQARKAKMAA